MSGSGRPTLEIAANSLASALAAQEGGADRIELCSALELGGLTPSHAAIALARDRVRVPLYVLIRPRAGDFVYSGFDVETMCRDIGHCVRLGCDGVVIGALDGHGAIDRENCRLMLDGAGALGATFHRAFDCAASREHALEEVIALGCERVLTSGGAANAASGADAIAELVRRAGDRIVVMPGAGIDADNLAALRARTGAREFHASARLAFCSRAAPGIAAPADGMSGGETRTDADAVRALVRVLGRGA